MVQQPRNDQPLYSCVVPVDTVTGHADEEVIVFGTSIEDAKHQAEQLLIAQYECNSHQIEQLMQLAKIELLASWCSPDRGDE
ncbi:hypothetical protein ACL6C3_26580 [Capilliphycus salinus ALCB114379]|uniref:hypothetical protein n=1 Tax=Capilliphycus salinus TaxID=2768948 RepID=UPI0039A50457